MKQICLIVNNKHYDILVDEHELLSTVIREKIGLSGTKIGCEQGSCGACTVLLNNKSVLSCITPVMSCDGAEITTIEALAENGHLHKLQQKFVERGAIQCGFCTPGMVMTTKALLDKNPNPTLDEIKKAFAVNLCRCTGYKQIFEAVKLAAKNLQT